MKDTIEIIDTLLMVALPDIGDATASDLVRAARRLLDDLRDHLATDEAQREVTA